MAFKNPFDPANLTSGGGGLWDGKTVTIISAKTAIDPINNKDGSPWLDEKGQPGFRHVLTITGVSDDNEIERREAYSAGLSYMPTADGEGFIKANGQPVEAFNKNSEMAKFIDGLINGGFDVGSLFDAETGKTKVSKLVGARFIFKGVARLDKNGNIKKNEKGYDVQKFYPVQFVGYKEGVPQPTTSAPNVVKDKAIKYVVELLNDNGGKVGRADLVRKLSSILVGDPDASKIVAMVTRDDIKDVPWKRDAIGYSL